MKLKKTILSVVACMVAVVMSAAIFTACGPKKPVDGNAAITKIELLETAEIETGATKNVIVQLTYSDGSTKKVNDSSITWNTSNADVATVMRGIVSGKSKGTANITATVGEVTSNTCAVTVVPVTVTISDTTIALNKAETKQLTATVERDGVVDNTAEIEWSSSDNNIATVDQTGLVTGWADGTATITAQRKNAPQSATCEVSVTWEKPVGYKPMEFAEQNKLHPDAWGYWNAQAGWQQGLAEANAQYTSEFIESEENLKEGFEYIGMGKATFEYTVTQYYAPHTYQIFYRSSDNFTDDEGVQGKLHFNHNYEITLKVMSNVSGTIHVNPYDDIRAFDEDEDTVETYNAYLVQQETDGKIKLAKDADNEYKTNDKGIYVTDHDFELVANEEMEITVIFRHDDCGYIYQTTVYDNMGTALHIQLADLGWDIENDASRGRTVFSVYDVQFKDLGEATNPVECDETKHADYVDPDAPIIPDDPEVLPVGVVMATEVTLTVEGEGDEAKAIFNLAGTIDLTKFDSVEAAKTWLNATHFDLQECGGGWSIIQFNRVSVTVDEEGTFLIKYDITRLGVDNTSDGSTGAYSGHFTEKEASEDGYNDNKYRDLKLDAQSAVHGASITVGNKKYSIVNYNGSDEFEATEANNWGQPFNYGCVAIKVENV